MQNGNSKHTQASNSQTSRPDAFTSSNLSNLLYEQSDPKKILELYRQGKYSKKPFPLYPDEKDDSRVFFVTDSQPLLNLEYQRSTMAKYELETGRFYRDQQYEHTLKSQYLRPNRVWRAPQTRMKVEDIQKRANEL